jgi:hypothetical protein
MSLADPIMLQELQELLKDELVALRRDCQWPTKMDLFAADPMGKDFPKKCFTCNKVFLTRDAYLKETQDLKNEKGGTQYDPMFEMVQEYRNCICGSTMLIYSSNRRDESSVGEKRREIFARSLGKANHKYQLPIEDMLAVIRGLFRDELLKAVENDA